jgi:pilus assembly protein Flp/PilA
MVSFLHTGGTAPPGRPGRGLRSAYWKGHSMLQLISLMHNKIADVLRKDDRGATAVEYGLIVTLIAVVIIAALIAIGNNLLAEFNNVAGHL